MARPFTKNHWCARDGNVVSGRVTAPVSVMPLNAKSTSRGGAGAARPRTSRNRDAIPVAGGRSRRSRLPRASVNATSGRESASAVTAFTTARSSASALFRNLRRAGTLPKRSSTTTRVPFGCRAGETRGGALRSATTSVPRPDSSGDVVRTRRETDAIEGSASPRKPIVPIERQVLERADLGRRVPLEGQPRVPGRHAGAVVHDLDPRDPPAFDVHADAPRAGVERVLHELLDGGRRALHDLARGDLVDERVGENAGRVPSTPRDVIDFGARRVQRTAIAFSTSAISRGAAHDRHSGPFSVTRTSSSILTPMFHHFGSTPSLFSGM